MAYITVLNVLATFSVVVLHCNGCFWQGPAQGRSWITSNLIETSLYWPVPVFLMISGATLMGYRERMGTIAYLKRRVSRTLMPFIAWSLVSVIWAILHHKLDPAQITPLSLVDGIINARYVVIYWYFPMLFAIYLSIPVLSLVKDDCNLLRYAISVCVVFAYCLPLVCRLLGITYNVILTPPPMSGYVVYVLLGWTLSRRDLTTRERWLVYALGIAGWLMQLLGTFVLSSPELGVDRTFKGYVNVPALLQAVAVFVFARSVDFSRGFAARLASICGKVAPLTLGVYLTHWYVKDLMSYFLAIDTRSILWRTAGATAVFCICLVLVWVLRKVPIVNKTMG